MTTVSRDVLGRGEALWQRAHRVGEHTEAGGEVLDPESLCDHRVRRDRGLAAELWVRGRLAQSGVFVSESHSLSISC